MRPMKRTKSMARITEMHKRWMKEPKYRKAYEALEDEFAVAKAITANAASIIISPIFRVKFKQWPRSSAG
jgi:hypothetical protein